MDLEEGFMHWIKCLDKDRGLKTDGFFNLAGVWKIEQGSSGAEYTTFVMAEGASRSIEIKRPFKEIMALFEAFIANDRNALYKESKTLDYVEFLWGAGTHRPGWGDGGFFYLPEDNFNAENLIGETTRAKFGPLVSLDNKYVGILWDTSGATTQTYVKQIRHKLTGASSWKTIPSSFFGVPTGAALPSGWAELTVGTSKVNRKLLTEGEDWVPDYALRADVTMEVTISNNKKGTMDKVITYNTLNQYADKTSRLPVLLVIKENA